MKILKRNYFIQTKIILSILIIMLGIELSAQVGINTDNSNPDASAILDVKSNNKGFLLPRMTSSQRELISSPVTGLIVYDTDHDALYLYDGASWDVLSTGQLWERNSSATYLNNVKDVGIGTSSPMGKLHIHDATHNTTLYITPGSTFSGDSATIMFSEDHNATYGMYWMYDGAGNEMELWGKNSTTFYGPHLTVKRNSGDVAIGNNFANAYRLSVDGKIMCEEVRVSLEEDWPDYVFNKNYNLPTTRKLEKFIDANGHLPNIPSADEINDSGIEVGEMQRLMMEKIEELTLYIIEQQKHIEKLEGKISKINKR